MNNGKKPPLVDAQGNPLNPPGKIEPLAIVQVRMSAVVGAGNQQPNAFTSVVQLVVNGPTVINLVCESDEHIRVLETVVANAKQARAAAQTQLRLTNPSQGPAQ